VSVALISIVLPVYNEAERVTDIVASYLTALESLPERSEIILALNGCRDNSREVCDQLASRYPSVRVAETKLAGWGRAVRLGLQEAHGDLICYTNLSRTTAADLMSLLTYAIAHPNVAVKANRKIRESWRRRLGSFLYNLECRMLFGITAADVNGTPKVFPRTFEKLLGLTRDDDLIDAEFALICRREGYPLREVPVFSYKRHGGRSTTNYHSAWKMYAGAFQLWRAQRKGVA
jgi:glycosyltransferase involved in cell wall biosynthesis